MAFLQHVYMHGYDLSVVTESFKDPRMSLLESGGACPGWDLVGGP